MKSNDAITLSYNNVDFCLYPMLTIGNEGSSSMSILPNENGEFVKVKLNSFSGTLCVSMSSDYQGKNNMSSDSQRSNGLATVESEETPTPILDEPGPQFVSPPPRQKQLPFQRRGTCLSGTRRKREKSLEATPRSKKQCKELVTEKNTRKCKTASLTSFFPTLGQSTTQLSQILTSRGTTDGAETDDTISVSRISCATKPIKESNSTSPIKEITDFSENDKKKNSGNPAQYDSDENSFASDQKYFEEDISSNTIMELDGNIVPGPEMTSSNIIECAPDDHFSKYALDSLDITDVNIPSARWGQTMVLIENSRLLVYGGERLDSDSQNLKTLSDLHVYDLNTKKWTKPINCEGIPRAWHSATFLPDRNLLIAFGGESIQEKTQKKTTTEQVMILDTELMLWYPPSVSGDVPIVCSGHTATFLPDTNQLVIFGGVRNQRWKNNIAVLDTIRWAWSVPKVTGLAPRPRSDHSVTALSHPDKNGSILVYFGGTNGTVSFDSVHVLDTNDSEEWSWSHPNISGIKPSPRSGHCATLLEDNKTILIYGGWDPHNVDVGKGLKKEKIYGDSYLLDTESWSWRAGPKPRYVGGGPRNGGKQRVGHSAILAPGTNSTQVLVFGGRLPDDEFVCDFQTFTVPQRMLGHRKKRLNFPKK